jgi:hypothetical protein
LNDITFVEAARVLAERLLSEHANDEDRLANAFLRVVSREPSPAESTLLLKSLQRHRAYFERHADRAQQLLQVGESPKRTPMKSSAKGEVTPSEVAAWTTLCSALLNLDEAVTKE